MKIPVTRNLDLVFHRSVLRQPIDALKRAAGFPVPVRERSTWEALRAFELRPRAPLPAPVPLGGPGALPANLQLPVPINVNGFNGDALATQIADQAFEMVAKMPDHQLVPDAPQVQPPRIILTFTGPPTNTSSDEDQAHSSTLLQPHSGRASPAKSAKSASSTETVLEATSTDVLGRTQELRLRHGGEKRMLESLPPEARSAFASVIEQTGSAPRIDMLDQPSETSPGMASLPVHIDGRPMTAFLSFDESGRITTVDASDESLQPQFEASDPGRPAGAGTSASAGASASGSSSRVVAPPLLPVRGVEPRVDVSSHMQRTPIVDGGTAYSYNPRPDVDHGIWAQVQPNGKLWLGLVAVQPELSSVLGSGTDMVLGLAQALNRDGVGVREIVGAWGPGEGMDSQYLVYRKALAAGVPDQEAAMSTFFGKVARMFGFTDVQVSPTPQGDFNVKFKRPPEGPAT